MKKKIIGKGLIIIGIIDCVFVIIYNNINLQHIFFLLTAMVFLPLGTKLILENKYKSN